MKSIGTEFSRSTAVALQVPGKLLWDVGKMRFTNNEKANALLRPHVRKGWDLKL